MSARDELHLGLDLGTSGVRAVALDRDGTQVAEVRLPLPAPRREGAARRQDPRLWWSAACDALQSLAARLGERAARARTLAVDGTSGTVLVTDAAGAPLGDALLYDDAACTRQALLVETVAPQDSPARGASAPLARLLHLQAAHPQAAHLLHQADWIAARLRGTPSRHGGPAPWAVSDHNNALKLGFDALRGDWPGWFDALPLRRTLLPAVVEPGTPLGRIEPDLAEALGLPAALVIAAGTTDGVAAFLATGADQPGDAVTSLGSTLVLKLLSPQPVSSGPHGVYSHRLVLQGRPLWLAGGASNSGGAALLAHFDAARLAELTPRLRPEQPTGLDYYPLPAPGERFPVRDPHHASRTEPRPADDAVFLQGLLEGIAAIEAEGYRCLAALGAPALRRVISVGGGSRNPAWTRLRGLRLGVPMVSPVQDEAACGAARLAARAARLLDGEAA